MQSKVEANFINYPIAFQKSQELLLMLKSAHFPLDLFEICTELNIILSTKAEYMEYRAATHQSLPEIPIGDDRSYLTYNRNGEKIYSIIYDEKPYYRWRIWWHVIICAGCPYGNAPMERYFNMLKSELIYHHSYSCEDKLFSDIENYVLLWCNSVRPHSFNNSLISWQKRLA